MLNFSKALESLRLKQILHEQLHLLPKSLRDVPIIVAWRMPRKLAAELIAFRYPRSIPRALQPGWAAQAEANIDQRPRGGSP